MTAALTLAQVAERLGVSLMTVRREVTDGKIKTVHVRSCVRVTEAELARYLGERPLDTGNPWVVRDLMQINGLQCPTMPRATLIESMGC
jgi:excisionase family DNA binding protein